MSYTRTDYMSFDNQPEEDIYSGTTYRPLLSDDEDLTRIEAEEEAARLAEEEAARAAEEARLAEEAKRAEEEAARAAEEARRAEEEAARAAEEARLAEEARRAEEEAARAAEEAQAESDEVFDAAEEYTEEVSEEEVSEEEVSEEDEDEYEDDGDAVDIPDPTYPEDLTDGDISPRVLQYIRESEEAQNAPPRKIGGGLRITPFLNLTRKFMPVELRGTAAEQDTQNAEPVQEPVQDMPVQEEYIQDEYVQDESVQDEYAQDEYVQDEYVQDEYAQDEYAQDEYAQDEYAQDELYDEAAAEGETYLSDEQTADYAMSEDEEYAESDEGAFQIDFAALFARAKETVTDLLKNRMVSIAVAAVLIVAVLIGGISWLNHVGTKRAKIPGVSYSTYSQGIELLTANISETYRSERQQLYLTNTSMASAAFNEDMTALEALLPSEKAQENDELFITSLTVIQDAIADAVRDDAQSQLNGTTAQNASASASKWQAIEYAVSQLSMVTSPSELASIVTDLDKIVHPTPSPTPVPTPVQYETLREGMMDSTAVRAMQYKLINLGYLSGEADGDFGPGTSSAVKAFQRAAGLSATGVADQETLTALNAPDAPRGGGTN